MLPGEVNLNASRFQGNALDERVVTRAEIELRHQAYNVVDFFKKYVPGFEDAALLDVAPKLGVRETRRILGDYLLTGDDVKIGTPLPRLHRPLQLRPGHPRAGGRRRAESQLSAPDMEFPTGVSYPRG